jgi:ankyrin repeat protein
MLSLIDLPAEIIIEISKYLPSKYAVVFSCTNRQLYKTLAYTRSGIPRHPRILAAAVKNRRDPATIKYLFRLISPTVQFGMPLDVLPVAFECQNSEALEVLCGEDCFDIRQGDTRKMYASLFFEAVFQGHELGLEYFIKLWPNGLGSALVGGAAGGSIAIARRLIEYGADVNALGPEDTFNHSLEWKRAWREQISAHEGEFQLTPLASAAANGHLELVQLLVQHGAMIDVRDKSGNTPLCWAASHGKHEVVNYILRAYPAEVVQDLAPKALEAAGNGDHNESIILLWHFLTPKPEPSPDNARWLLRAATACQDRTLLSQLCEDGFADVYQMHPPPLDRSAIAAAIEKDDIDIFKILLQQLAYGDQTLPDLLVLAIKKQDEHIVSYLLDRVNVAQLHPMIFIHAAPNERIFNELASAGVNQTELAPRTADWISAGLIHVLRNLLSIPDFEPEEHLQGETIFECAMFDGKPMFEFLLSQHRWDENLSPCGPGAERAIPTAIMAGHVDLLEALFRQGFPYSSEHELLLLAAKSVRHSLAPNQVMDFLLKRNPRALSGLNSDGQTVLFELIASDNHEVRHEEVQLLLDHGANPLQKNLNGNTPLDEVARRPRLYYSFLSMVEYLQRRDDWHVIGPRVDRLREAMKKNLQGLLENLWRGRS